VSETGTSTSTDYIPTSQLGVPGGVAPLDAASLVQIKNLPQVVTRQAQVDIPTLIDGGEIV
jgi:hypothetical protein